MYKYNIGNDIKCLGYENCTDATLYLINTKKNSQKKKKTSSAGVCVADGISQFKSFLFVGVVFWVLRETKSKFLWKYEEDLLLFCPGKSIAPTKTRQPKKSGT